MKPPSAPKCIVHNRAKARTTAEHLIMSASVVCVTHAREEDSGGRVGGWDGREGGRESRHCHDGKIKLPNAEQRLVLEDSRRERPP